MWRPNAPADVTFRAALLESGQVSPVTDSVRPLEDVQDAFRRLGAQQHTGRLVLTVASD